MADSTSGEPSRASNALFKRQEQLQRWRVSETAREPVVKPTKRNKLKFDDGTVFLSAVSAGDLDEVKKLLQKGTDVNYQNIDGVTALHQACIDENFELVELLVQHKANLEVRDNEGWSALHAAASSGNLDVTEFLVEHGADIAAVNNEGELPLDLAEEDEMEEYLQDQLRKASVDVEAARAEEERIMEEDAQSWLNKGKITEVKDPQTGATALHVAAAKEYTKVINLLLQAGADPNSRDVDEWTPLHAAAHWGQKEACKLLADYGADFTLRNHVGLTPIDLAEPEVEKYLEELKKKQMEKPKINAITPTIKTLGPSGHPPLTRRRSITRIKDTGLSKTDVTQERKALAERIAVQAPKEPLIKESKQEQEKNSSTSTETDSEESEDSNESTGEESEERENQRRTVSEKFAKKRGSESDSESEKNNRVSNAGQTPVVNNFRDRGRNPAFSRFDNKNAVTTATNSVTTSRPLNSNSRIYPASRNASTEKKEEAGTRPRLGLDRERGRLTSSRSEDTKDSESSTKEIDSRRKVFERTRPASSSYLSKFGSNDGDSKGSRVNNEDTTKDSKRHDEGKERVEVKTNEDNTTRSTKDTEERSNYRSQLRDTKLTSYQPRARPSSRNFDEDKTKHNDVDLYLSRRNNLTSRASVFTDRDREKNDTTSTTSSYTSRRNRIRDEADTSSTARDSVRDTSRTTSNYLRSTSADNVSSRISEREKEREKERQEKEKLEKEKENEKQSEKEKAKEKETEKESVDKSAGSSAARARKKRRPREKRKSTGVAYMPSESDEEEPDELQQAKKNTMMNEDIEEKDKPKEETRSLADRIRAGRTISAPTTTTDRYKNISRGTSDKMPTDVNSLQDKLRETQTELDETKTKLEKTVQEKNKLEKKLETMEEDLKHLNELKEDNQRLKDENGALIRVISKLSRTPT